MQFCVGIAPAARFVGSSHIMTSGTTSTGKPASTNAEFDMMLPFHFESHVELSASANAVFTLLDDHSRLSAHMTKPSWMMAGSVMTLQFDASKGRAVGAKINLQGRVLGIPLSVEEIVTERNPPLRKIWSTIGKPKLVVIGSYRMGFEITPGTPT